jgi:methyl-accepting chemotaxis protein
MAMLNRFSISKKIVLIISFSIVSLLIYCGASYSTIKTLSVSGNFFQEIIQSKDLIADILPPPEYIIESYLIVEQLADERDSVALQQLQVRLQDLESSFKTRHKFWLRTLTDGPLKEQMTDKAYEPAIEFYTSVKKEFLPALVAKNYPLAQSIMQNSLKQSYNQHRKAIDAVIVLANQEALATEMRAIQWKNSFLIGLIAFGLFIVIVLSILSFQIRKSIVSPLKIAILNVRSAVDQGIGVRHLDVSSQDEIGELVTQFNRLIDKTKHDISGYSQGIAASITTQKNLVAKMGNTILENDVQTSSGIEAIKILEDFTKDLTTSSEKMASTISTVATAAEEISTNINTVASTSEEISTTMISVAGTAEQMSSNFRIVDSAVKELYTAITSVAQNARTGTTVADNASAAAKETSEIMGMLGKSANEIGKVTSVIQVIAKQTNLLALNAAIEAASAGDAGRGFAVVANEVKELAKQTATATEDISARIEKIQGDTQKAVAAIQLITNIIGTINDLQKVISDMVEKQTLATTHISSNISQASVGSGEIARLIAETARASKQVSHNINEIAQGANVVAKNIAGAAMTVVDVNERISGTESMAQTTGEIMQQSKTAAISFTEDVQSMFNSLDEVSTTVDKLSLVLKPIV